VTRDYLLGTAVTLFATISLGYVQWAEAQAAVDSADRTATNSASPTVSTGLEEIVVTAQRRSENEQRAALPITAFSGGMLAQLGVTDPQALSLLVPSVTVGEFGPYTQVFLRGIGDFGGTPLSQSPVAVNLDQVYQASPALTGNFLYDLDRVELLRGPQGTLYGRNASGGALNIITKKPDFDSVNGYVTVGGGNYSAGQFEGAVNIPVSENLAVRAAAQVLTHDGYYEDGYDDNKQQGGRIEALYRPISDLSILVTADYEHQGGRGAGSSLTPNPVPGNPWIGVSSPPSNAVIFNTPGIGPLLRPAADNGFNHIDTYGVTSDLEWDLGPVTLSVIPAYRYYDVNVVTYDTGNYDLVSAPERQYSIETRLGSSTDGPLKYTVGAYYFKQSGSGVYGVDFGPLIEQLVVPISLTTEESAAVFGQATFSLTEALRLTGGLRYTYEDQSLESNLVTSPSFSTVTFSYNPCSAAQATVPVPRGTGFLPGAPYFCSSSANGHQTTNRGNWKAGIEYDLAAQSLLYFTAGTGFKAGGFSQGAPPNTFGPETLTAYELGSKNRFLDNTLQVNAEAFLWKYNDQQVSQTGVVNPPPILGYLVRNAGQATLYGIDFDVHYRFTSHDTFSLAVEYLDTNYGRYEFQSLSFLANPATTGCNVTNLDPFDVSVNCAGKPLVRAPLWSGALEYAHVFDLRNNGSLTFSARTKLSTGYYTSPVYVRGPGYQSSFSDSSIDLTYAAPKHWLFTGYVNNVENKAVSVGSFENGFVPGVFYNSLMPPRTYGLRATYKF
jgi:iron complex outermembrane receptor protein